MQYQFSDLSQHWIDSFITGQVQWSRQWKHLWYNIPFCCQLYGNFTNGGDDWICKLQVYQEVNKMDIHPIYQREVLLFTEKCRGS